MYEVARFGHPGRDYDWRTGKRIMNSRRATNDVPPVSPCIHQGKPTHQRNLMKRCVPMNAVLGVAPGARVTSARALFIPPFRFRDFVLWISARTAVELGYCGTNCPDLLNSRPPFEMFLRGRKTVSNLENEMLPVLVRWQSWLGHLNAGLVFVEGRVVTRARELL